MVLICSFLNLNERNLDYFFSVLSSLPSFFVQGTKLTFLPRSHLAPKFSKVVAKAKKLGAIKKKDSWKNALYSNVKWKGFPSFEVKCLRNHLKGVSN